MMPINFADKGVPVIIRHISGNSEVRQHLADLGFVVGGEATVISETDGNLIVNVKNVRVAVGKQLAAKIMI